MTLKDFAWNVGSSLLASLMWAGIVVAYGNLGWVTEHQALAVALLAGLSLLTLTFLKPVVQRLRVQRNTLWIVKAELKIIPSSQWAVKAEIELSKPVVDVSSVEIGLVALGGVSLYLDEKNADIMVRGNMLTIRPHEEKKEQFQAIGTAATESKAIRVIVKTPGAEAQSSGLVYVAEKS